MMLKKRLKHFFKYLINNCLLKTLNLHSPNQQLGTFEREWCKQTARAELSREELKVAQSPSYQVFRYENKQTKISTIQKASCVPVLHGRKLRRELAFAFKKSWHSRTSKSSSTNAVFTPKLVQNVSFILNAYLTIHTVS